MSDRTHREWQFQKCESISLQELLFIQVRYCVLENTLEREIPASIHTNKDSAETRQSKFSKYYIIFKHPVVLIYHSGF
jgi:hypothetical protein